MYLIYKTLEDLLEASNRPYCENPPGQF